MRSFGPNTRVSKEFEIGAELVDLLNIRFDTSIIFNLNLYTNFKYTPESEITLLSYSLGNDLGKIQQRMFCAPNCEYSDGRHCFNCIKPTKNNNGICTDVCPSKTYSDINNICKPCDPACGNCTGPTNGNCLDCAFLLYFNYGKCDIRCQNNLADAGDKICKPCGEECDICKDIKTCAVCSKDTYLKDGRCLPACGNKYFKSLLNGLFLPLKDFSNTLFSKNNVLDSLFRKYPTLRFKLYHQSHRVSTITPT